MHSMIGSQLGKCLKDKNVRKYIVTVKTVLCVRKLEKENLVPNYVCHP